MKIEMRESSVEISGPLAEHVERQLEPVRRRLADRVDRVVVRLVDLNGPKGGDDKRCRVTATLRAPVGTLIGEAVDADAYVAVRQAVARLEARIGRLLRRARTRPAQRLMRAA